MFILLLVFFLPLFSHEKTIYIYPGYWGDLFDESSQIYNRDNCLEPMLRFKKAAEKAGYEIIQTWSLQDLSDFKYLIVFDVISHRVPFYGDFPKEKMILFLWEPPSVIPENYDPNIHAYFSKVYTWNDALVDNKKYFKLYYPSCFPMLTDHVPFNEKKLSCLIASFKLSTHPYELYTERFNTIKYMEYFGKGIFDLYGRKWPTSLKTYKGEIDLKVNVLRNYRFSFAYENIEGLEGYITEKIFDCFRAGCVPIYWGASNIENYVPENCFIDRRKFPQLRTLVDYLKKMNEDDYNNYITHINEFLASKQAKVFSQEHFINLMLDLINE